MAGFLDMLLDPGDIAAAGAQNVATDALFYGELALQNVDQLREQVVAQREQIRDLAVLVTTLAKMLGEANVVDPKVLRYRVDAEIEERIEAAKPTNRKVRCAVCGQEVVMARTEMTGDGMVCDVCMARGGR